MKVLLLIAVFTTGAGTGFGSSGGRSEGRKILNINPAWKFYLEGSGPEEKNQGDFTRIEYNDDSWDNVSLPHTLKESSLSLDDSMDNNLQHTFHRHVGLYRKILNVGAKDANKKYFLHFQGVMQSTELWVNGVKMGKYEVSGYDSFHFDVTDAWQSGENLIAVKVDNRLNETTPPDGKRMKKDFILFGGIYRDVELITTGKVYVTFPWEEKEAGVRISFPSVLDGGSDVNIATTLNNEKSSIAKGTITTLVLNAAGQEIARKTDDLNIEAGKSYTVQQNLKNIPVKLWHPDTPTLYTAHSTIIADGEIVDIVKTRFGVRSLKFTKDRGFFINGKHLKLQGSNRHQTWPFIGNAVPNSLHRKDAEIIKAAGMNWIRLSHYPHDPDFLDACDELGLLLLEEGPTWMGTNGKAWTENLYKSLRSMIRRDRNHPSIMTWNACINHSAYNKMLGDICMEEDSRPVGAKMPRTPMDFAHQRISGGGALTIEHTGHTYPRGRGEVRLGGIDADYELAKRHWEHISASFAKPDNAGMAIWAMFDYNTFHNIDEKGIVWHGVNDLTRLPKTSYLWHQSEFTEKPMVHVVNHAPGKATVFSNCDSVKLWQGKGGEIDFLGGGNRIKAVNLKHPPIEFDVAPNVDSLRVQGIKNGQPVVQTTWRKPGVPTAIQLKADSKQIVADGSDMTRVVATVVDKTGTPIRDLAAQVTFSLNGEGFIVGDNPAPLRAGKAVVLIRGHYRPTHLEVKARIPGLRTDQVQITSVKAPANVHLPSVLPSFHPDPQMDEHPFAYLSDLNWTFQQSQGQRWGRRFGLCGLKQVECNEHTYQRVIDANAPAQAIYNLGGLYKTFTATLVAMDGKVSYQVLLDGRPVMKKKKLSQDTKIEIPVTGAQVLTLLSNTESKGLKARAIWANARLFYGRADKLANQEVIDARFMPDLKTLTGYELKAETGKPYPMTFNSVRNTKPGTWVESNVVMITGGGKNYPIKIKNGEYRIYSQPWTDKPGKVFPGDAITVRGKAGKNNVVVEVTIGTLKTNFRIIGEPALSEILESVEASSEHDQNSRALLALDGDEATMWHTNWSGEQAPHPHYLIVKLKSKVKIKGILQTPRKDLPNGRIAKYKIHVGDDRKKWTTVASGVWQNNTRPKKVLFKTPVITRYIKVEALSEVNGRPWASIAELDIIPVEK